MMHCTCTHTTHAMKLMLACHISLKKISCVLGSDAASFRCSGSMIIRAQMLWCQRSLFLNNIRQNFIVIFLFFHCYRLAGCNLSDECCESAALVLQSSDSLLRELDLSNNNLQDRKNSPQSQLEKPRFEIFI